MIKARTLFRLLIAASNTRQIQKLSSELTQDGFACYSASDEESLACLASEQILDLIMIDTTDSLINPALLPVIRKIKTDTSLPAFALLPREKNDFLDSGFPVDDFAIEPWDAIEIALRTKRILQLRKIISPTGQSLKHADLIIYLDKCQVMLDNKQIILTFKEYQLLKFLMNNKGKVFSREILLEKVWGWDYYGGDRTVDVHIRRLRGKIEDKNHIFIETFRGMGYSFKDSI